MIRDVRHASRRAPSGDQELRGICREDGRSLRAPATRRRSPRAFLAPPAPARAPLPPRPQGFSGGPRKGEKEKKKVPPGAARRRGGTCDAKVAENFGSPRAENLGPPQARRSLGRTLSTRHPHASRARPIPMYSGQYQCIPAGAHASARPARPPLAAAVRVVDLLGPRTCGGGRGARRRAAGRRVDIRCDMSQLPRLFLTSEPAWEEEEAEENLRGGGSSGLSQP